MTLRSVLEGKIRREMKQRTDDVLKATSDLKKAFEGHNKTLQSLCSINGFLTKLLSSDIKHDLAAEITTIAGREEELADMIKLEHAKNLREVAKILRDG